MEATCKSHKYDFARSSCANLSVDRRSRGQGFLTIVVAMFSSRLLAVFLCIASLVRSEDLLNGECGTLLNDFLTCIVANGVTDATFTDVFAEGCQSCIDAENNAGAVDAESLPCDELVSLVVGSLDSCQSECALVGCTAEVNAVLTCFTVTNSNCADNTGAPSASPSMSTGAEGGFLAFLSVIREIVALIIDIFGSGALGRR